MKKIKFDIQLFGGRGASSRNVLSKNQSEALEYYVSGDGMWINEYLRNDETLGEQDKTYLNNLEKVTNNQINEKVLYRSVDAQAIFGKMSDLEFENLREEIVYNTFSKDKGNYSQSIAQNINNKIKNATSKVIKEKGFISTTTDYNLASNWNGFTGSSKDIVLKIRPKSTTKGIKISKVNKGLEKKMQQKEVLLKNNQSYKVKKIYSQNGKIMVDVDMY